MIEVLELSREQIDEVMARLDYGHLACSLNNRPYVVPVHFAFDDGEIFIYTTEGRKSKIIAENPRVCLQIEEVVDNHNWTSVIVEGEAALVTEESERDRAFRAITAVNPTLTPAVSIHWMDNWVRENIEVILRLMPLETSGRRAAGRDPDSTLLVASGKRRLS